MLLLPEQHGQCIACGRQGCLLPLSILLLLLKLRELDLGVLTPHGVFLRLLLVLKEVREPREPGHFLPHIVKPYEFPPPE
ncbi:hypothetical protein WT13_23605 [Burkholderia anthina]|nr:hypothetical protein WT13_23605 [Burkholderia anthina]